MARLILYTSVEVIHHGAEICLHRDLYLPSRSQKSLYARTVVLATSIGVCRCCPRP